MNKNVKKYIICWAILLVLFNVIVFVVPAEVAGYYRLNSTFWVSYILVTITFIGQLICAIQAFKSDNLKKLFYNIPLITISYSGLVIMTIAAIVFMAIPYVPDWLAVIICAIILAFTAIAVFMAKANADIVSDIDEKNDVETSFIRSITADAKILFDNTKTSDEKANAEDVYEALKYSDPRSNTELEKYDNDIKALFESFKSDMSDNNKDELINAINSRNEKCKLYK